MDLAEVRSLLAAQVGRLNLESDAHHSCFLACGHFPRFQPSRATQCHGHSGLDRFNGRCFRGDFIDPGIGRALGGLIGISSEPMLNAFHALAK